MRLQFPVVKEKFRGRGRKCSTSFANNGSKEFHFKGIERVLDGVNYRRSTDRVDPRLRGHVPAGRVGHGASPNAMVCLMKI